MPEKQQKIVYYQGTLYLAYPPLDGVVPSEVKEGCGKKSATLAMKQNGEWKYYDIKLKEKK